MTGRIRKSIAAALRVSLLSGCGALGLLAFSAGAAVADDGGNQGLLGSVTSVVESVAAPVQSIVNAAPGGTAVPGSPVPEAGLPSVSNIISSVPAVVGNLSVAKTVAPVTAVADTTLSQVPVVSTIVPEGTATSLTQPLLGTVDATIAPVLPPVQQVLTPVVDAVVPAAEVLDPVVNVLKPVVDPVLGHVPATTGPLTSSPITKSATPEIQASTPILPSQTGDAGASTAAPVVVPSEADAPTGQASTASSSADQASTASSSAAPGSHLTNMTPTRAFIGFSQPLMAKTFLNSNVPSSQASEHEPETPAPYGLTAAGIGAGAGLSGSTAQGGPGPADVPSTFDFLPFLAAESLPGRSAALPLNPAFDPGSTPD